MVECPTMVSVGTVDIPERVDREKYFATLDYVELSLLVRGVKDKTRDKWAATCPRGAVGLVVASELREISVTLAEDVAAFGAACVVFRSPPLFSPSQAHRDQLRRFFGEVATVEAVGSARVWVPDGHWEPRAAVKLGAELGIACAIDPLVREPGAPPELYEELEAPAMYFRIEAPSRPGTLDLGQLEELAALVEHYEERSVQSVRVVFATHDRWRDARAFKALV
jgi:uncharacterized protein YecE (DUF72 family)